MLLVKEIKSNLYHQGFIQGGYRGYIVPPEDFSRFFFEKCTPCQGVHFVFWGYIGGRSYITCDPTVESNWLARSKEAKKKKKKKGWG